MKEQLVTFETAKLAKEKGFNEPVLYHYLDDEGEGSFILTPNESHFSTEVKMVRGVIDIGETNNVTTTENLYDAFNEEIEYYISAPTQSLLQKWLREVHDMHIEVHCRHSSWIFYIFKLSNWNRECLLNIDWYGNNDYLVSKNISIILNTYEEVLEIGLQEGLKLIK